MSEAPLISTDSLFNTFSYRQDLSIVGHMSVLTSDPQEDRIGDPALATCNGE